ncbi:MAG: hypothetical protein CMF46_05665 [Legionellales bacterium]|nr:hypothetical protein [Legionellales bacterium]|tara:strand:- start:634 stop:1041 length:408 start_codon:yes stop_codon:yes gene_type:complete
MTPFPIPIALWGLLLTIAWVDIKHQQIPDTMTILLVIWTLLHPNVAAADRLLGSLWGFYTPILANQIYSRQQNGIGFGDTKLMLALGGLLGLKSLVICCLNACSTGLIYAWVTQKDGFPFGPFLCASACYSYHFI